MIEVVINTLGRGGAERSIMILVRELNLLGCPARIVSLFTDEKEYPIPDDLAPHVVRLHSRSMADAVGQLYRRWRRERPELVYSLMPQSNLTALFCARLLGVPAVTSERATPTLIYRPHWKLLLALLPHALSDRAVFISQHALSTGLPASALGDRVSRNACVLLNPVEPLIPASVATRERNRRLKRLAAAMGDRPGAEPLRLVIASRMNWSKGHLPFLEQAEGFLKANNVALMMAGEGPEASAIAEDIRRRGLEHKVSMGGFFSDVAEVYRGADIVILSALTEGFGRIGFEAYQAGCLVVGTPENSFQHEVSAAPAWSVIPTFHHLKSAIEGMLAAQIPADGSDISEMNAALAPSTHARKFLDLLGDLRRGDASSGGTAKGNGASGG